jgi:hypothetical protein
MVFGGAGFLTHNPCGSELARDSGGSDCIDVGCAGAIASKLAPTGVLSDLQVQVIFSFDWS